ncbi:nicotinamide riboside transporter PnuC [Sulfurovum riftiae]|uniref:Nicotinamide riboside transporter PnuC n=1 Tax=Sulfurovum riftiae TaxID=1630136 RepID=A0A151CI00_9BACT|nr:nicotinamide riboside transporter PnuC [Sulfurovum riftiae]KYJ87064.1 nicotinamide mononucleotide transporter [Sulfurovum riftiae]
MEMNWQGVIDAFSQMSGWEILAVILGISYVILAVKESQWAWPFAFFSTLIYTIIFWDGALVSSSVLNFYYMAMAIYGFILWKEDEHGETLHISQWHLKQHLLFIGAGLAGSIVLGYLSETYLGARFAYHDAFVMVFSGIATWMMAKKVLENWLYWMVIDSTAIVLYFKSGYLATIVLFTLYVILAFYGYASWRKAYDEARSL